MDENDFDQILHTDFHPNPPPPRNDVEHIHDHEHIENHEHELTHEHEQHQSPLNEEHMHTPPDRGESHVSESYDFDHHAQQEHQHAQESGSMEVDGDGPPPPPPPRRGMSSEQDSGPGDKRQKQREQNRLAALRSRAKKKRRYNVVEAQVKELQEDNEHYRARLNKLLAERGQASPSASPINPTPTSAASTYPDAPEVDQLYFRKVVTNLESLKYTLLKKEIQLDRMRQGIPEPEYSDDQLHPLHERLIRAIGNVVLVEAECKSIRDVSKNLSLEKYNMGHERDMITREVDARMAVKQINGVGDSAEADNVEIVLLKVRGWIDETIASWDNEPEIATEEESKDDLSQVTL